MKCAVTSVGLPDSSRPSCPQPASQTRFSGLVIQLNMAITCLRIRQPFWPPSLLPTAGQQAELTRVQAGALRSEWTLLPLHLTVWGYWPAAAAEQEACN